MWTCDVVYTEAQVTLSLLHPHGVTIASVLSPLLIPSKTFALNDQELGGCCCSVDLYWSLFLGERLSRGAGF